MKNFFSKSKFLDRKINAVLIISLVNFVVGFLIAWFIWARTFDYVLKMTSL